MLEMLLSAAAGGELFTLPASMDLSQVFPACNPSCISQSSAPSSPALFALHIPFQDPGMHLHLDVLLPVILADNREAEIGAEPLKQQWDLLEGRKCRKEREKEAKKIEVEWRRREKGKVKRKK